MDFEEAINEDYNIEYWEIGETGVPMLIIRDVDDEHNTRFYAEDITKIRAFLNRLEGFSVLK